VFAPLYYNTIVTTFCDTVYNMLVFHKPPCGHLDDGKQWLAGEHFPHSLNDIRLAEH